MRGLKFAKVPNRIPYNAIIAAMETTCKQLKSEEADHLRKEVSNALHTAKLPEQNVDKSLKHAILDLCKNQSITILPPDKGNIMVVMDRTDYREILNMLNDPAIPSTPQWTTPIDQVHYGDGDGQQNQLLRWSFHH